MSVMTVYLRDQDGSVRCPVCQITVFSGIVGMRWCDHLVKITLCPGEESGRMFTFSGISKPEMYDYPEYPEDLYPDILYQEDV